MGGVNKAIIVGRLGRDPELRNTGSGKAVCNFSMATSYKRDGEEFTDWHNVVVWGKQAEACAKYLRKGSQAYVDGRMQTRKWEKDGQERYTTEVVASWVEFLGGKSDNQQQGNDQNAGGDDIPF